MSCVPGVDPSIETCTPSQRPVEARQEAVSSVMSVPLLRTLNRMRFSTMPSISSARSSLQNGSPPCRVTLKTAHSLSSLKNRRHSSPGRSDPESPALVKWLQYAQRRLHRPVMAISTDVGALSKWLSIIAPKKPVFPGMHRRLAAETDPGSEVLSHTRSPDRHSPPQMR